jgi:hypothetical protein
MRTTQHCVVAFVAALTFTPIAAMSGEWRTWPVPDQHRVVASFNDGDGGSVVVICDTATKHVSITVQDSAARWPQGQGIDVETLPDTGQRLSPSYGYVVAPTELILKHQATFDLWTMGQAKSVFRISAGDYVRSYSAANFRNAVEPVLKACGDRW